MRRKAGANPRFHARCRGLQRGVDRGEVAEDGLAQSPNGCDAHDGDQADEHAVFDEGRALVVLNKTSNKITHDKEDPLQGLTLITSLAMPAGRCLNVKKFN